MYNTRRMKTIVLVLALAVCGLGQNKPDESPHTSGIVTANGTKLHYLDWGGSGEVIVFLTGFGDTAHVFDWMAPKFTDKYRVMALTRRGFGDSDKPETGYDIKTLTEDVRAFLDLMKIKRVHLFGHSAGGNEMTNFATKYPKRTLSLVYLDASYDRREVAKLYDLDPLGSPPSPPTSLKDRIDLAFITTIESYDPTYKKIKSPVLSFFAWFEKHWDLKPDTPEDKRKAAEIFIETHVRPYQKRNIERFRRELPGAHVVELNGTHHYFFRDPSKRDEVIKTIREFLENKL